MAKKKNKKARGIETEQPRHRDSRCAMNVTVRGITYRVTTEADIVSLLIALDTLQRLARRKAA